MWELVKGMPEAIKNWRNNGDELYQLASSAAAVLVVASAATNARPSELLAGIARAMGLAPVARYLHDEAPPFLSSSSPQIQSTFLGIISTLFVVMVIVPLWHSRHDDNEGFAFEPLGLIGSRSVATVWILLLVAEQQGPSLILVWTQVETGFNIVVGTIGGFLALGLLYKLAQNSWFGRLLKFLAWPLFALAYRILVATMAAVIAILLSGAYLLLSLGTWLTALESDRRRKNRVRFDTERAGRNLATGAVITNPTTDRNFESKGTAM